MYALEKCSWTISTSKGRTKHATSIIKAKLSLKLNQNDVKDVGLIKVKAKSYGILVGLAILYPMGFTLDFYEETTTYRPGCQVSNKCKMQLLAHFVRVLISNLVDLYAFSGFVDVNLPWFMEDFDENTFATYFHVKLDAM